MSKGDDTKQRILELAAPVFNTKGYAGASLSDILAATGLQKGGLYNHFGSKEELALASFDWAVDQLNARWRTAVAGKKHAIDRLMAVVDMFDDYYSNPIVPGGCPIVNTSVESDDSNPQLRKKAQEKMDRMRETVVAILRKGTQRSEIQAGVAFDQIAVELIALLEGGIVLSKLYGDPHHLKTAQARARKIILSEIKK
jgi:TetR/AcrR family transcriptional regulator, transcriptional repressor for nem operon